MIGLTPVVAIPHSPWDVLRATFNRGPVEVETFRRALAARLGAECVELYISGRSALAAAVRRAVTGARREVLVPAYTCWSVASAVVRAGARVRVVDIDPRTFDIAGDSLLRAEPDGLAAAVPAHLLSCSVDIDRFRRALRTVRPDIHVIEDAAQVFPRRLGGAATTLVFSFDRGKPLPLGGGGALAGGAMAGKTRPLEVRGGRRAAAILAGMALFGRRGLYRVPSSMPWLGIGSTVYDPQFEERRLFFAWQARLGLKALDRIEDWNRRRRENARFLQEEISSIGGWTIPEAASKGSPIRFPVLAPSRRARDSALRALRRAGVAASAMYPGTLLDIPELRPHLANPDEPVPGARAVADRLLTLPVYPTLRRRILADVARRFRMVARESRP